MDLEQFIKDLPPELLEKAKQCKSTDELLALIQEEKVELPDEALEAIAGGKGHSGKSCGKSIKCPKCGSKNVRGVTAVYVYVELRCKDCGYTWWTTY